MIQERDHDIKESECCCEDLTMFLIYTVLCRPPMVIIMPHWSLLPCFVWWGWHGILSRKLLFYPPPLSLSPSRIKTILFTFIACSKLTPVVLVYWHISQGSYQVIEIALLTSDLSSNSSSISASSAGKTSSRTSPQKRTWDNDPSFDLQENLERENDKFQI